MPLPQAPSKSREAPVCFLDSDLRAAAFVDLDAPVFAPPAVISILLGAPPPATVIMIVVFRSHNSRNDDPNFGPDDPNFGPDDPQAPYAEAHIVVPVVEDNDPNEGRARPDHDHRARVIANDRHIGLRANAFVHCDPDRITVNVPV